MNYGLSYIISLRQTVQNNIPRMLQNWLKIETYHHSQHEGVVQLLTATMHEEFEIWLDPAIVKDIEVEHDQFWVALADQRVIGTIGLKLANPIGVVRKMCVHRNFRGPQFGIAFQLLAALEWECKRRTIGDIYLGTRSVFKAACRFYEKAGYTEVTLNHLPKEFPMMSTDDRFYMKRLSCERALHQSDCCL